MLLRILDACIDPVGHSQYPCSVPALGMRSWEERGSKTQAMRYRIERIKQNLKMEYSARIFPRAEEKKKQKMPKATCNSFYRVSKGGAGTEEASTDLLRIHAGARQN